MFRSTFDIPPGELEDYREYLRSGLPFRLGDIVVGDIDNGYDSRLLEKALAGNFKAESDLIRRIAARRAQRREKEAIEALLERHPEVNANKVNTFNNQN